MSVSSDDMLKALFQAEVRGEPMSGSNLSRHLNISHPAVTRMAMKMAEEGLLVYRPYQPPGLSERGRELAAGLIRKHRLWEMFLFTALEMGWNEVHREAEQLEHQTSDFLAEKIDVYLGYPAFDPHGEPIPDKHGRIRSQKGAILLSDCEPGKDYVVVRVTDKSDALMDHFTDIGLKLQGRISVVDKVSLDQSVIVMVKNNKTILSQTIARNIFVEPVI